MADLFSSPPRLEAPRDDEKSCLPGIANAFRDNPVYGSSSRSFLPTPRLRALLDKGDDQDSYEALLRRPERIASSGTMGAWW
jgi:hypothetical protein